MSILINSFVTAGLNSPCERFQARVVWLLPLAIIIILIENYELIIKTIYNKRPNSSESAIPEEDKKDV